MRNVSPSPAKLRPEETSASVDLLAFGGPPNSETDGDLLPPNTKRWVIRRKAEVVAAVGNAEDLRAAVVEEYEVEPARCEADLLALLEKLRSEGLIEIRTE